MALDITVTKISVTKPQEGIYLVTFNLNCVAGTATVINQNFSERKRPTVTWQTVGTRIYRAMQDAIDVYNETASIFDSTEMDDAVTTIQNALTG